MPLRFQSVLLVTFNGLDNSVFVSLLEFFGFLWITGLYSKSISRFPVLQFKLAQLVYNIAERENREPVND